MKNRIARNFCTPLYVLDSTDFLSLKKKTNWLTDNVINAFAADQTELARLMEYSVISLKTAFTTSVMDGTMSDGFRNWLADNHLQNYQCWLMPLNINDRH